MRLAPNRCSAMRACTSGSFSASECKNTMRRTRSGRCARAASGQAAAVPRATMNSRPDCTMQHPFRHLYPHGLSRAIFQGRKNAAAGAEGCGAVPGSSQMFITFVLRSVVLIRTPAEISGNAVFAVPTCFAHQSIIRFALIVSFGPTMRLTA